MLRPNTLMEMGLGLGEPELDANSALTELDKGLRSPKLGEQCEAIVRFPNLFEKYPFPILINSACLKLAEVFRTSSNFLRIWVLRVCQQSERHLDKIINVDEFIRRIFSVIHSNDPVARALTLRTLGSLSGLISERKHVHHSIRVSLDSSDPVEVSAAIYAATCYAKCSKTFANSMCKKISSMVKRISTPNDLKLRLIPILKHMHHDVTIASTVQGFCQEILECYPSKEFVITTLHTMTELAAATMANLKDQVAFLLKHLEDPRLMVKLCVLEDLRYLGKKGGHLWEASDVSSLIQSVTKPDSADKMEMDDLSDGSERKKIVGHTLNVIDAMTTSTAILNCLYSPDSPLQDLLKSCFQSVDRSIKLKAIQIASSITSNWKNETLLNSSVNLLEMTAEGVDSVLKELSVTKATTKEEEKALTEDWKRCLAYGVRLCKSTPAKCDWLCSNLVDLLMNWKFSASARSSICQAIGAVGDSRPEAIQNVLPQILELLESLQGQQIQDENTVVVTLVAVVLQAHQKFVIGERVSSLIQKLLQHSNMWDRYRIARNALRYGQPGLAEKALEDLSSKVSSENLYLWLSALHNISQAEALITDTEGIPKLQPRLNRACNLYLQAVMSLKAASSPTVSMQFHIEYVKIRSEMFVAFMNFLSACGALQFSPPPAIAPTIANVSRDELLKSGRVVTQLRKSIRDFQGVADMYARLYQTAFDADNDTLENIQILQQLCRLMSYGIETLVHTKDHPSLSQQDYIFNFNESTVSTMQLFVSSCNEAMNVLKPLKPVPSAGVKNEQLEVIKEAARILIETPLPYPRFFFQNLQTTRVKIAVSPQPRAAGENVTVILGNNLALKVEGVIHQVIAGSKNQSGVEAESTAKGFRRPKSIRMAVTTTPSQSTRTHSMDMNKLTQEPSTIVKEVNPHRDFFTAQFLLGSWSSGLYTVTVDTSLIDYDGRVWLTGPRATLGIRVLSEVTSQPMSSESQKVGTPTGSMPTSSNIPRPGPSGTPGGHLPQTAMGRF